MASWFNFCSDLVYVGKYIQFCLIVPCSSIRLDSQAVTKFAELPLNSGMQKTFYNAPFLATIFSNERELILFVSWTETEKRKFPSMGLEDL